MDDNLRSEIIEAVRRAKNRIRWKPGKDIQHLAKRLRLGHLPAATTLVEYEEIITQVLADDNAKLYLFLYGDTSYPTLVATIDDRDWLVMIGLDGIMETAFPPDDLENYLTVSGYVYVGTVGEL